MPILLKLHWSFCDGLKICIYYFDIIIKLFFVTFFASYGSTEGTCEKNYLSGDTGDTLLAQLLLQFHTIFSRHGCFGYGLKTFMWLRYNHQIILFLFLQVELSYISSIVYNKVNGQGIPCGCNFSYSFYRFF